MYMRHASVINMINISSPNLSCPPAATRAYKGTWAFETGTRAGHSSWALQSDTLVRHTQALELGTRAGHSSRELESGTRVGHSNWALELGIRVGHSSWAFELGTRPGIRVGIKHGTRVGHLSRALEPFSDRVAQKQGTRVSAKPTRAQNKCQCNLTVECFGIGDREPGRGRPGLRSGFVNVGGIGGGEATTPCDGCLVTPSKFTTCHRRSQGEPKTTPSRT